MEGKIKIVYNSKILNCWDLGHSLIIQVVSRCEVTSEFGPITIKGRDAKGAGNKNWLPWGKCFPWSWLSLILGAYAQIWYHCDASLFFSSLPAVKQDKHASEGLNCSFRDCHYCLLSPVACQIPFTHRPCFVPRTEPVFYVHHLDSLCKPVKCDGYLPFMNWETEAQEEKPCPSFKYLYLPSSKWPMLPATNTTKQLVVRAPGSQNGAPK